MMNLISNIKGKLEFNFSNICIFLIILWPLVGSFFGVDMADTGSYLYNYQHPFSETVSLFTFLATIIGAIWYRITFILGIWGLNFLEVLLEWGCCYFTYKLLIKDINRNIVLLGILISLMLCDTYINIYNFHQLNMFLMIVSIYYLYDGLTSNKSLSLFISGAAVATAVFVRLPSVSALVLIAAIIFWKYMNDLNKKEVFRQLLLFLCGFLTMMVLITLAYFMLFGADRIISEITRAFTLSGGESGSSEYGTKNIIVYLIKDTVISIGIGIIIPFSCLLMAYGMIQSYLNFKTKKLYTLIYLALCGGCGLLALYAFYRIVSLPSGWAKLSPFGWSFFGIILIFGIYYVLKGMASKNKNEQRLALLGLLGILLNYLVFVGSGVRFRHTILGMWILIPLTLNFAYSLMINRKISSKLMLSCVRVSIINFCILNAVFIFHYLISVNMYDDENIFKLHSRIDSSETKLVLTTSRQANTVNDIVGRLNDDAYEGRKLIVYGDSVLLYSLTDKDAYIRPWTNVPSYTIQEFKDDLARKQKEETELPVVVLCRTSSYRGFDESVYEENLALAEQSWVRKAVILDFLKANAYEIVYENEYYTLYDVKEDTIK